MIVQETASPAADTLPRKERERLRREGEFLDAAEALFAEHGFHATTMEDIARVAEYGTGTIYRHFASKEDLYRALFARKLGVLLAAVETAARGTGTPRERLLACLRAKLDFFRDHQAFLRLFAAELAGVPSAGTRCLAGTDEAPCARLTAALRDVVVEGIRDGSFADVDPDLLLAAYRGATTEPLVQLVCQGRIVDPATLFPVLSGLVLGGIERRSSPSSPPSRTHRP